MMKKLLALALAALMLAIVLPTAAFANPAVLDFTTGGDQTGTNWTWDSTNKTITLNGATITAQLILPDEVTIAVTGTNEILSEMKRKNVIKVSSATGMYGTASVVGTGSLMISDSGPEEGNNDIATFFGNLTVGTEGQETFPTVSIVRAATGDCALMADDVTMYGGILNITANADGSGALVGNNIVVHGGQLTAIGRNAGIVGNITISDGTIIAKSTNNIIEEIGHAQHAGIGIVGVSINVTGGTVWAMSIANSPLELGYCAIALATDPSNNDSLTIVGSTTYEDTANLTDNVEWTIPENASMSSVYHSHFNGTPARTIKITAAGSSGGDDDGPIIDPPMEEEPIRIIVTTPTEPEKNPSTGANDVVAAAMALMAVSALGAVALLRKK